MRNYDLTPLFRSMIGVDQMNTMLESALRGPANETNYPPYNIEKLGEDEYQVTMAVAGFGEEDLEIVTENSSLVIRGRIERESDEAEREFLHRGIATRSFEQKFRLAEHIRVTGASMQNGLLMVELVREIPEALKPRTIEINATSDRKVIEGKKKNKNAA